MDLTKQIASVVGLNDYIELSEDVDTKHKDVKISFNMSTILSLKKLRSLEIEHFNKCDGIGAAFKLLERMLGSPPSKTWALLGPEVISLIQYWLDAVRKHLISHHINWWIFLKQLLGFIKKIRQKDHSLSSILVEEVAEAILDLATSGKIDVNQRYEILQTFNLFCAESSREIRLTLKTQFEPYFIRLSTILATCGHLPTQFAALEALLRWLQPRHDPTARKEAAGKWFLPHLYSRAAVDVFLNRSWMNFFQDSRDFLNSHNDSRDLVTSVICKRLRVGEIIVISGSERRQNWLDINSGNRSVTVTLEPQLLEALGAPNAAGCETLTIQEDIVDHITLHREGKEVTLSVWTLCPPAILPSLSPPFDAQCRDVTLALSSRAPLPRVDAALRQVFQHKYRLMLDIQNMIITSPEIEVQGKICVEDNARFSHPVKEKRRKPQSGFVAWSKRFSAFKSPSTASTASLAQLHDKLANLPYYEFTKEPVSVCAQPELSVVNELNESQISNSLESRSTLVLRRCAVRNFRKHIEDRKSQSDGDITTKDDDDIKNNEDDHKNKGSQSEKYVNRSATVVERDVSSLFAATIGSNDNSIINATIERLPKDKEINTDNLIDLLVQEALQSKSSEEHDLSDKINIEDVNKIQEQNNQDTETIEDTQYTGSLNIKTGGLRNFVTKTPKNKVVSKSTSDESNTEAIIETPVSYVSVRRRYQKKTSAKKSEVEIPDENVIVDVATVENFFSQHFSENQMGDVIISPTLAKKVNATSSESSDELLMKNIDENFDIRNEDMPDFDIVECLNDIVDKVCSDFDKCTEYLGNQGAATEILTMAKNLNTQTKQNATLEEKITSVENPPGTQNQNPSKKTKQKKKQPIKFKITSNKAKSNAKAKGKLQLEPVSKMSTIMETIESDGNKTSSSETKKTELKENENKTPLTRRKRKLYSPKDDQIQFDKSANNDISSSKQNVLSDNEDEISLAVLKKELVTPKSTASCYKQIEKERKQYKRIRNRKSKNAESPASPRSKKLDDVFEHLKDNIVIHENENITLVDKKSDKDVAIYNFTSDSEDEDFKQKKKEIQKRTSTTTIGSGTSVISTRRGRARTKVKYTEDERESANESSKPNKRTRTTKRKASKTKSIKSAEIKVDRPTDLIDEKMRKAAPETLNTSFVAVSMENNVNEPIPSVKPPELEIIPDEEANIDVEDCKQKALESKKVSDKMTTKVGKGFTKEEKKSTKRQKIAKEVETTQKDLEIEEVIRDEEGTVSPLPYLVVENEVGTNKLDDSLSTNFMQKIQKAYKDGPDAHNDTIATQNMLSDNDKAISPQTNITDVLSKMFGDDGSNNSKKNENSEDKENSDINFIDNSINSDQMTNTSKTKKRHNLRLKCRDKNYPTVKSNSVKEDTAVKSLKLNNTDSLQVLNISQKSRNKSVLSQIDGINYDEIICIDDKIETRSRVAKSRSVSKEIEIMNITADSEGKSDISIATDGITGHGDINELPPSPKLLNEKLTPREIEDMDATIREYYIELSNKVNNSKTSCKIQNKDIKKTTKKIVENDDDACEPRNVAHLPNKEKLRVLLEDSDYDIRKMLPSRRESSESSSQGHQKSPVVSITRISSKEMAKWLPSAASTPESSFKSAQKTRQSTRRCIRVAKNIANKASPETSFETAEKSKETNERPKVSRYRKSQISPVKLDDFMPKRKTLHKDNTNSKEETNDSVDVETISKLDSIAKKYFLRPENESSPISRGEKSEQSTPKLKDFKRKSPVAKAVDIKRRKLDEEFRMDEKLSRQSSNVEDWLKNLSSISKDDNTDPTDEALQNLMEKLDTTLEEIHQNTTKDFISMFVEAQKQLVSLKEERRRAYQKTALDILSNVTQMIDQHFADLDQRAEDRENSFMRWLRGRAGELLRRDVTHKQALVALLKEDARAAASHRDRSKQGPSQRSG